jgi:hypothetical protein
MHEGERAPVKLPPPIVAPSAMSATTTAKVANSIICRDGVCVATISLRTCRSENAIPRSNIALASRCRMAS